MKIQEVLANFDNMKPNQYGEGMKLTWLNEIERKVYQTMSRRECDAVEHVITPESDYGDTHYLGAMVDYFNGETARYNNSVIMFDQEYGEFENYWYREHRQKSDGRFRG